MLSPITALGTYGSCPANLAPGPSPVSGPVVTIAFDLAFAGLVPHDLVTTPPQQCQAETPNVALQVTVVDQNGNAVDVSAANVLQFWLLAPDGTPRAVGASFVSNGRDGLTQYVTTAQDLNEAGLWQIQGQLTFGAQVLLTSWGSFVAGPNIADA